MALIRQAVVWFNEATTYSRCISAQSLAFSLYHPSMEIIAYFTSLTSWSNWIWDEENSWYKAVITLLWVLESIIHFSVCKWKTGCSNQRCKCLKIGLKCWEMCQCQGCENSDQNNDLNDIFKGLDSKSKVSYNEN